jgi:hypothetical protein
MPGLFDDLIPNQGGQGAVKPPMAASGLFDDLIPKRVPEPEGGFAALDSDEKINSYLKTLPEDQRDAARRQWADAYVSKEREGGETGMRIRDAVSRVARNVPGIGAYLDEADAGLSSLAGGDYQNALEYRRAQNRATDAAETPKISTPLGDIYESGVEKAIGGLAGGFALPGVRVTGGTGIGSMAANAGTTAGLYGAAQGFGEGEGAEDRFGKAESEGIQGSVGGLVLGGGLRALGIGNQAAANAAASTGRGEAVSAAERLRDNLGPQSLPEFVADSDNRPLRSFAGALQSFPGGTRVRTAAEDTIRDLGNNVAALADQYGQAGTGATVGATDSSAATDAAGQSAASAIRNWIGPVSRRAMNQDYAQVYQGIPPGATADMANTRAALQNAINRSDAATSPAGDDVMRLVGEAATRPQGMTIEGLQQLKSEIQSLQNNKLLPEYTKLKDYLRPISQALDNDLRDAISTHGGQATRNLYDQAVQNAAIAIRDRKTLSSIVGNERADSPNAASPQQVIDRLISYANGNNNTRQSSANIAKLQLARTRILQSGAPGAWNDVASAVIRRMGEGPSPSPGTPGVMPGFSPDRFLTSYNRLSGAGRDTLFGAKGTPLRQSLEDIATISNRFRDLRQFQNPSGTAHSAAWFELALLGWEMGPLEPIAQILGAGIAARAVSRQATAKAVSRWGNAVYNALTSNGGRAAVKLTTLNLAKEIADDTGGDEDEIKSRLMQATGGLAQ